MKFLFTLLVTVFTLVMASSAQAKNVTIVNQCGNTGFVISFGANSNNPAQSAWLSMGYWVVQAGNQMTVNLAQIFPGINHQNVWVRASQVGGTMRAVTTTDREFCIEPAQRYRSVETANGVVIHYGSGSMDGYAASRNGRTCEQAQGKRQRNFQYMAIPGNSLTVNLAGVSCN